MSITSRTLRTLGVALAAMLAWAALAASSAHALTSVSCIGNETGTFSPNLTNTPTSIDVTFTQNYICGSLTHPSIVSGTYHNELTAPVTCALLTTGATRTRVITWNTGETSTYQFTSTVVPAGNAIAVTRTGSIIAGKFTGSTAIEEIAGSADLGSCATTGLSSYGGVGVLAIKGL